MKRLYLAAIAGTSALFGLAYLKNTYSYKSKSLNWRLGKSLADTALVVLTAYKLPAMLVAWLVMWITRPLKRRGIQVTLSIIFGIIFHSIGGYVLEVLCILSIVAVDLVTGSNGIYGWWKNGPPPTFMPNWKEPERRLEATRISP